ncbi:TM0106 family RecB-like putative nuclease, partial [candidate division FCPU426 bacterium]|nr:TM0106 family RecB-like putative nuclease [candidate division FCPU426 bacterium]
VDQGLVQVLAAQGVDTIPRLLQRYDEAELAEISRPWGKGMKKVGGMARSIRRNAEALHTGREILLQPPQFPASGNYVMFDLEGLPPHLDEWQKIYLWGMQVFGERPGFFQPALAGFGPDGDRQGWESFLAQAGDVFQCYGNIPFVHWHHYEKTNIAAYRARYGDRENIAQRVMDNLFDLLPCTKQSLALPVPSYSLKVVEKYVGFARTMEEFGGDWAMAKYIEATETEDAQEREEVIQQIMKYNEEDLQALWAVFQWLRGRH